MPEGTTPEEEKEEQVMETSENLRVGPGANPGAVESNGASNLEDLEVIKAELEEERQAKAAAEAALAIDELRQDYDPNLQTATRAQERSDAILRQASLRAKRSNLVVPANVAQELYDVITVADARCSIDQEKYRVLAIRTDYDRRKGQYDQTFTLGAP